LAGCLSTALFFYGNQFKQQLDIMSSKIEDLQQQVSSNQKQISDIKDKVDTSEALSRTSAKQLTDSINTAQSKTRDAKRLSDMRQLISAQEMYYGSSNSDAYLVSATYPAAIGAYLANTSKDPINSGKYVYKTIANTGAGDNQRYCYYALLEGGVDGRSTTYYTASQGGNFYRSTEPKSFDECAHSN
jgi:hypothetical protein